MSGVLALRPNSSSPLGVNRCSHYEDAGVRCSARTSKRAAFPLYVCLKCSKMSLSQIQGFNSAVDIGVTMGSAYPLLVTTAVMATRTVLTAQMKGAALEQVL